MDQRIIIPEKVYVGVHPRNNGSYPYALVTAWGTDSAARNRMLTVDSNSKDAVAIPNTPTVGFVVDSTAWKDEIKIRDPRGFLVGIRSDHVIQLMRNSTMINGMIVEPCVYARSNGQNVLLNTRSDVYRHSQLMTEIALSKDSWKNAKPGNRVTLTNGVQGVYLGKYHSVNLDTSAWVDQSRPAANKLTCEATAKFVILRDQNVRHYSKMINKELVFHGSAKLARIDSKHSVSPQEAEALLNSLLNDNTCVVEHSWRRSVLFAVSKASDFDNLTISVEQCDEIDLEQAINNHRVVVDLPNGELALVMNLNRNKTVLTHELSSAGLEQNQLFFNSRRDRHSVISVNHTVDANSLKNLKRLRFQINSVLGNNLVVE